MYYTFHQELKALDIQNTFVLHRIKLIKIEIYIFNYIYHGFHLN